MTITFVGAGAATGGNVGDPTNNPGPYGPLYNLNLNQTGSIITVNLTLTTHASTQVGDNVFYILGNTGYSIADGLPDSTEKTKWGYTAPPSGFPNYLTRFSRPGIGDVMVFSRPATVAGAVATTWKLTIPLFQQGTVYLGCVTWRGGTLDRKPLVSYAPAPSLISSSAGETLIVAFGGKGPVDSRGMTQDAFDGLFYTFLHQQIPYAGATGVRDGIVDGLGETFFYGISLLLTEGHPPTAATPVGPSGNVPIGSIPVSWVFNDPDPDDVQSSADFRFRASGAGSWTEHDGIATGISAYTLTDTLSAGTTYEWQVRTYDSTGRVSPWSASSFFTPRSAPSAPTITAPSSGATVAAFSASPLTWTNTTSYPYTQARRIADSAGAPDTSTIYEDSGVQSTAATTYTFTDAIVHEGVEHWQVRYANYPGLWSDWADLPVTVALSKPMRPTITGRVDAASVTLIVGNPATKSGFVATDHNDITRTWDGQTVTIATGLPLGAVFVDQLPGPGANDYTAVAYSTDGVPNSSY